MADRNLAKVDVVGSIPIVRSSKRRSKARLKGRGPQGHRRDLSGTADSALCVPRREVSRLVAGMSMDTSACRRHLVYGRQLRRAASPYKRGQQIAVDGSGSSPTAPTNLWYIEDMAETIPITLTRPELLLGAQIGSLRHIAAVKDGRRDQHGFTGDGWGIHIEGALGEIALCKALGIYWPATVNSFGKADALRDVQIRTRSRNDYDLIVRDGDKPHERFVLVTGLHGNYMIRGWILGAEAMQPQYRATHGDREEAYFVPAIALSSIKTMLSQSLPISPRVAHQ